MARWTEEFIYQVCFGLLGGVVKQIILPDNRIGFFGFASASIVGLFCGLSAASLASALGAVEDVKLVSCSFGSVFGFTILQSVLIWWQKGHGHTININGPSANQFGDNNNTEQNND